MSIFFVLFILGYLSSSRCLLTDPDPGGVVDAVEGSSNVTIFCEVNEQDGRLTFTAWRLTRPGENPVPLAFDSNGNPTNMASSNFRVTGQRLLSATSESNLTILTFDSSLENALLECGVGNDVQANFTLRLIRPPILRQNSTPVSIVEGSPFSFNIEDTGGYPPIPQFTWSINELTLSSSDTNPDVSVYPLITFSSLNRSQSGNYSMTASNEGGTSVGYFILDVTYGPEGTPLTGPVYALTTNSVTIVSYSNVVGNPVPSSTWTKGGSPVSGGRFNTDAIGQLMVSSVQLSDAGNYTNTLVNSVDSISNIIELRVVEVPSEPRNVMIEGDPDPTVVNVSWTNPSTVGTPPLIGFQLILSIDGMSDTLVINYTAPNNTDTEFSNSLTVTGLNPNSQYTLTVRAVSSHSVFQTLFSNSSSPVQFNTSSTIPQLEMITVDNINGTGNLSVRWTFVHKGGIELDTISVICQTGEELMSSGSGIDDDTLMETIPCSSMISCAGRSSVLGPVTAGSMYTCTVTATNSIGSDTRRESITPTSGIPSQPNINSVSGQPDGSATLEIVTAYPGVTDISSFRYIIVAMNENGVYMGMFTRMPSTFNTTISLNLDPGQYQFIVSARNQHGTSLNSTQSSIVTVVPATISTTTPIGPSTSTPPATTVLSTTQTITDVPSMSTTTPTPSMTSGTGGQSDGGLSGGAIAGIIIAIIIILAILVLIGLVVFYLVYKNRGGSYQVERKSGGVKVEEFDIDIGTELKPTPSGGESLGGEGGRGDEHRPELHYADLEHFAKKPPPSEKVEPAAAPVTKPQPIEEVQYAEIKPQNKPKTDTPQSPTNII